MKTYECIEHNVKFYMKAENLKEAQEAAQMYGGSVIREIKSNNKI